MKGEEDKLSEYISTHRKEFDIYEPSPEIWSRIEKSGDLPKPLKKKNVFFVLSTRAAAVAIIFVSSFFLHRYIDYRDVENPPVAVQSQSSNTTVSEEYTEFEEAQTYYVHKVSNKIKELEHYAKDYPGIMDEIKVEIETLDSKFTSLQSDLKDGVAQGEIIDAMIQTYRLKLEILEKITQMLKEKEVKSNNTDENEYQHNF
ncbi:MAG: hypothetical protein SNJ71_01945 [Bacteroidales bacterium]